MPATTIQSRSKPNTKTGNRKAPINTANPTKKSTIVGRDFSVVRFSAMRFSFFALTGVPVCILRDSHFRRDALGNKGLNHVALLYVIEVLEVDTAFHAIAYFAGIVFEALERTDS